MIERAAEDDGKRPVLKELDLGLVGPDLQHILWRSHEISLTVMVHKHTCSAEGRELIS